MSVSKNDSVLRFEKVDFSYTDTKPILNEVDLVVRRGAKLTLMGQNGAGKSTIFSLITGEQHPDSGRVIRAPKATIAIARQVVPREQLEFTVTEFFQACFPETVYDIDRRIDEILEVVNLHADHERHIKSFSGGQQARLLLASALIQDPDILLLDEPTNNLDKAGIAHLTDFLIGYRNTCLVISHDADFLNAFTHGVLYLDVRTHTIEQYRGDYHDVVRDISARIEKENRKNAQLEKVIQQKKDKANVFAHKGGGMRAVAKRMREMASELEEAKVDVRREDKTIRPFTIPVQEKLPIEVMRIESFQATVKHKVQVKKVNMALSRKDHLHLIGPNGIGKSRLLASIADNTAKGVTIDPHVRIGYYRQDFSMLDFDETVYHSLLGAMTKPDEQEMRSVAAGFLLTSDVMKTKIGSLSEGQKGLVGFAQLVLMHTGLLILDEPTNHINFRHIPLIAKALDAYKGPMIIVSHVPEFMAKMRIDKVLDLER